MIKKVLMKIFESIVIIAGITISIVGILLGIYAVVQTFYLLFK